MKVVFLPGNVRIIDGKAWIFWRGKRYRYKKGDVPPDTASEGFKKPCADEKNGS